ncbi:MAG: glutamate 5-kinase [Pseudomonadota bacterium]
MDAVTGADALTDARRVVIKIGSALLVDAAGKLRRDWLRGLVEDVAALKAQGRDVLVVSSGSIALGRGLLGLPPAGRLDEAQAAAAVGQIALAQAYRDGLSAHGLTAAQVLVTLEDSENRRRYLNTRATLRTLLALGAVPIVNENDTVATDEIRYGDNDRLAAQVASLAQADLLLLLSDIDGLYTANPAQDPTAVHISRVPRVTADIEAMAGGAGSAAGKGGMVTKLQAAKIATRAGATMAIARGDVDRPLSALRGGARATWFPGQGDPKAARKQWISAMKPRGRLIVDAGAAAALAAGKSLLAAGVTQVSGDFQRGDPVEIATPEGQILGLGLAGYDAAEAAAIRGLKSQQIAGKLGHPARAALVHRDEMAV